MSVVRDVLVKINGDSSGFEKAMGQTAAASEKGQTSFLKLTGAVAAGQAIFAVASSAMNKLSSTAESVVSDTEDLAKSTMKLQREMGVSAESASSLLAVFKRFGVDVDGASKDMGIFAKKMEAAADPAKYDASVFGDLNIKLKDQHGLLRNSSDVLMDVADRFKEMPNGVDKTVKVMQLFGKSGKDLLPILNLGSAGMKDLEDKAKSMGLVLTQNNIDSVRKLIVAQKDWKEANEGLRIQLGLALMPALTNLSQKFLTIVTSDKFKTFIKDVTTTAKDLVKEVINVSTKIEQYLQPKFEALWHTLEKNVIPQLEKLWHNVIEPLLPVLGVTLVAAIGFVVDAINAITVATTKVLYWMEKHRAATVILAGVFGSLAASMALGAVFDALTVGFAVFTNVTIPSAIASLGALSTAFIAALPVAALLVGIAIIAAELYTLFDMFNKLQTYRDNIKKDDDANKKMLVQAQATATLSNNPKTRELATKQVAALHAQGYASGGFTGSGGTNEIAGIVHKGEYVIPKAGVNQSTGQPKMGGDVHVHVHMGMYAGMPVEKRQIAVELYQELTRAARAQGVQLQPIGVGSLQ